MKKNLTPPQALNRLASLCSRSEYAESDCRAKLIAWHIAPNDADSIMQSLVENHFVDDRRYAHAFTSDKFKFSGWGRQKIAHALRQKQIPQDAIADAIEEINEDDYIATLYRIMHSKARAIEGKDYAHAKAALLRFAASRGFELHLAMRCADDILKNIAIDNDDNFDY